MQRYSPSTTIRNGFRRIICCGCVVLGLAIASGTEQDPPPANGGFQEVVEVNLVNVDVYARDSKGNPIADLKREDFDVYKDGELVAITNFAELSEMVVTTRFGAPVETIAEKPQTEGVEEIEIRPIWVVLYIDNENLHPNSRARVLRRVREFVTETLQPPMQMMVVANQGGLKVLQEFTDDPRAVNSVIRSAGTYAGGWLDRASRRAELVTEMRDVESSVSNQGQEAGASGPQGMYQRVMGYAREENNALSFSLNALRQAVDALSGLEGRKSIVYVSNGLPMTPGLGLMHEYALVFKDNAILSARSRFDRQSNFNSLTATANSQEIAFYTLGAEGLQVTIGGDVDSMHTSDPTASQVGASNYRASLRYLAKRTGGIAVVNTNDVTAGLQDIRNDFFAYYSLGFPVGSSDRDRVHKVEVKMANRKDVSLRYRNRFVEKSLETAIQDRVLSGLVLGIEDNSMGLIIEQGRPSPATGVLWTVPVRISVPVDQLALLPQGDDRVARGIFYFGSKDSSGGQSDLQRQHHELIVKAGDPVNDYWKIDARFLMNEGTHRIVVAILDEITRETAYTTLTLSVP